MEARRVSEGTSRLLETRLFLQLLLFRLEAAYKTPDFFDSLVTERIIPEQGVMSQPR